MIGTLPIILGIAIASLAVTFHLCWVKFGTVRNILIPVAVSLICAGTLYWMYQTLAFGAEPQIREQWQQWLGFGALASLGGPLVGALLALEARRHTPNGKVTWGAKRPGEFH